MLLGGAEVADISRQCLGSQGASATRGVLLRACVSVIALVSAWVSAWAHVLLGGVEVADIEAMMGWIAQCWLKLLSSESQHGSQCYVADHSKTVLKALL